MHPILFSVNNQQKHICSQFSTNPNINNFTILGDLNVETNCKESGFETVATIYIRHITGQFLSQPNHKNIDTNS